MALTTFWAIASWAGPHQDVIKLLKQDRTDDALQMVQVYLNDHPRDPQMRFWKGNLLNKKGQSEDAFQIYLQLSQDYPELAEPQNNLGISWVQKGEYMNAKTAFEMALKDNPQLVSAKENLASVMLLLAKGELEQALSLEPNSRTLSAKLNTLNSVIEQFSSLSELGFH